jgi:ribonuclease E
MAIEPAQPDHESAVAPQTTAPVAPAVESSRPPVASIPEVDTQVEPVVAAIPAETSVVIQEILKSDTVETFSMVENPAPAEAAPATATQAAPEVPAPAAPAASAPVAPVTVAEPPKPAPVRPAVGNSGSLFFTADADTPSSVTRHLFEPMPAAQPAAVTEKSEEHDLPLLADNDEASDEEKNQGSERSA